MSGCLMRLGSIRYVNSLPVDLGLLSKKIPCPAEIVRDVPTGLNRRIFEGSLEVSPVSVFWVAINPELFWVLPDLSISSESGVQSVLLFSREPIKKLGGKTIWVTGEGRTTPVLLEILCHKFYGFHPQLKTFPGAFDGALPGDAEALLLIGDDALAYRASLEKAGFCVTDLAEEWRRRTGMGFVFALWVTRRDFALQYPDRVIQMHEAILASKKWGLSHREEVVAEAVRQTGLSQPVLTDYFSHLSYDLTKPLLEGMNLYLRHAEELGFLSSAGPVSFFDRGLDSPALNRYNKASISEEK